MNFMDWHRNLRIVLRHKKKEYILTETPPNKPRDKAEKSVREKYNKFIDDELDVSCLMVATMSSELQKRFETRGAFDIMDQLKKMFQEKAQTEMCNLTKALMKCSMRDNESVSSHMFNITGYIEQLGCKWDPQLITNIIFASLSPRYSNFIMNYNMMGMSKGLDELLGLLKIAEEDMNKGFMNVLAPKIDKFGQNMANY
jgi:gag-polypeptide of LTR copia-type